MQQTPAQTAQLKTNTKTDTPPSHPFLPTTRSGINHNPPAQGWILYNVGDDSTAINAIQWHSNLDTSLTTGRTRLLQKTPHLNKLPRKTYRTHPIAFHYHLASWKPHPLHITFQTNSNSINLYLKPKKQVHCQNVNPPPLTTSSQFPNIVKTHQ